MAKSEGYTEKYRASGQLNGELNVRANPYDFGANVGKALQEAGQARGQMAEAKLAEGRSYANMANAWSNANEQIYKYETEQDVTGVHVAMAAKRAQYQQIVSDELNKAQPGDTNFVSRISDLVDKDITDMSQSVKTGVGQQTFAQSSSALKAQVLQQAIAGQGALDEKYAVVQHKTLQDSLSSAAGDTPDQWQDIIKQGHATIDDPNGSYRRVDGATRQKFKDAITESVKVSAALGAIRRDPNAIINGMSPEIKKALDDYQKNPPTPGMPPDLKADTVKPYDAGQIAAMNRRLSVPTKYDPWIEQAARENGIDPRELKLRIAAESNFDPNAKSSQGAVGIMQFTPETAKRYGINPNDPRDAIFGGAQMLRDYIKKAGGDMSKVDMMYYGGESGTGWGPNTKQYAANLAAVRQQAGLAVTRSPESFAPSPLAGMSDKTLTNNMPGFMKGLPEEKVDQLLNHAHAVSQANQADLERARVAQERSLKLSQESEMTRLIQQIYDPKGKGAITATDISTNAVLDPHQMLQMQNVLTHYENEQSNAAKSHPDNYMDMVSRIYAPNGDPKKLYNDSEIFVAMNAGKLGAKEAIELRNLLINEKNGVGSTIRQNMMDAYNSAEKALSQNPKLEMAERRNPGTVRELASRFYHHMEDKVSEYQKANKDPAELFRNPKNQDYFYNPELLRSFMPSAAAAKAATKVVQNEASDLPTFNSKEDPGYAKLPVGSPYRRPDGSVWKKQ